MLKPEEKAIYLFNRALKVAISLNLEPNKQNAKEICLNELLQVKEWLYDSVLIGDLQATAHKKTLSYLNEVKTTIEKI